MAYRHQDTGRKKLWVLLITVLLIAVAGAVILLWGSKPNNGDIVDSKANEKPSAVKSKVLSGKFITFTYSGDYMAKPMQASGNDLEMYMLTADRTYQKQIAVDVAELPGGNLSNNAAYNYRKATPSLYSSTTITVDGEPAIEWIKNDGSEITVQIPKNNLIATLSFTTGSTADQLQPEVNALISSFRWK